MRFLFGAQTDVLEKFSTATRIRPFGQQKLGKDFYQKEHTKPLFIKFNLLTVYNLCKYMAVNEIGRIITNKTPTILYESITLSQRNNNNLIILPKNCKTNNNPISSACSFWNIFIKKIGIPNPCNTVISLLKRKLKAFLLDCQKQGDPEIWDPSN